MDRPLRLSPVAQALVAALDWFTDQEPGRSQDLSEAVIDTGNFVSVLDLAAPVREWLMASGLEGSNGPGCIRLLVGLAGECREADDEGRNYKPSVRSVARACGVSDAAARDLLGYLVARGYVGFAANRDALNRIGTPDLLATVGVGRRFFIMAGIVQTGRDEVQSWLDLD